MNIKHFLLLILVFSIALGSADAFTCVETLGCEDANGAIITPAYIDADTYPTVTACYPDATCDDLFPIAGATFVCTEDATCYEGATIGDDSGACNPGFGFRCAGVLCLTSGIGNYADSSEYCIKDGRIVETQQAGVSFTLYDGTDVTNSVNRASLTSAADVFINNTTDNTPIAILNIDFGTSDWNDIILSDITLLSDGSNVVAAPESVLPGTVSKYLLIPNTGGLPFICDDISINTLEEVVETTCAGYDGSPSYSSENYFGTAYFKVASTHSGGGSSTPVPEFSDLGWILAAVLGAGGFFIVSRRRKHF